MNKLKYIIIGIVGMVTLNSCSEWLNVSPKTEVPLEEIFKKQSGFCDVTIGNYILLKEDDAYGVNLTMGAVEYLVSSYETGVSSSETKLIIHDYEDTGTQDIIQKMYGKLYNIISNTNAILNNIEEAKRNGVFVKPNYYEVVKGEALGLRAMCHLDILRLFGPVPSLVDGTKILSYVTKLDNMPVNHVTYSQYCELLLKDLEEAALLLKDVDPISNLVVNDANFLLDDFFKARNLRMNYYAVKALQARTNLYMGNKEVACAAAKEVIEAKTVTGTDVFKLGVGSDINNEDYTLKNEHIFALNNQNLYETYNERFVVGNSARGKSRDVAVNDLFGAESASDIRANLWITATYGNKNKGMNNKYYSLANSGGNKNVSDTRIPLLRLSEMYLILAEAAPLTEAQGYWDTYRKSRGLLSTSLTENGRLKEVMKEYRKEFYAEGQMFYFHKRINSDRSDILWFSKLTTVKVNYVLPLPITEIKN